MKQRISPRFAACLALVGAAVVSMYVVSSASTIASGLVSSWPFDGNANDAVDGHHGTPLNGATFAAGHIGNALRLTGGGTFDSSAPYVDLGMNVYPTSALTIHGWINPDNVIGAWGGAGYVFGDGRDCCGWGGGGIGLHLTGLNGAQSPRAYFYTPSNAQIDVVGTPMTPSQWHHVAMTFDGTSLKLYQDCVVSDVENFPATSIKPGIAPLQIGRHTANPWLFPFHGMIDELALYNRALSEDEIRSLFIADGGSPGNCPNYDSTPPSISATVDGTLGGDGWYRSDVTVAWTVADDESPISSSTGCEAVTVTADTAGTTFTCSATSAGGTATSSVTIKRDATAPSVACSINQGSLWPPNHKLVAVSSSVSVSDGGSGAAGFVLNSWASNEPDNGLGDGDTANDIQGFTLGTADTAGLLRAERSGKGSGRVYSLGYQASDAAGNSALCSVNVVVPHSR